MQGRKPVVFEMNQSDGFPPLDFREKRKRKRERLLIVFLLALFFALTFAEYHLSQISSTLPFVNSIFFFGLLNVNIIILIALVWLVFRNIGKLFIERRRKVLGARLKTKLVIAFLAFSLIPTLVLFLISALYINSSFDKWFSLKIQNTLEASLEITRSYYRSTEETAMHFAEYLAESVGKKLVEGEPGARPSGPSPSVPAVPPGLRSYLKSQSELLALDAVEFYLSPHARASRVLVKRQTQSPDRRAYPPLSGVILEKAFLGQKLSLMQHVGSGDLIRSLVPVRQFTGGREGVVGVIVVNASIPLSLVNKVGEISSVFDDYKETNPLKYPMKTTYLVILILITLVLVFVAVWVGLYMARELTVPVERLVQGVEAVGSGNLDIEILGSGHDEIAVLVESFNQMTHDLRDHRHQLLQAGADLEKRRLELEAILANIGTGVMAIAPHGEITLLNEAVSRLFEIEPSEALHRNFSEILGVLPDNGAPLVKLIHSALQASLQGSERVQQSGHWNFRKHESVHVLVATAAPLRQGSTHWGVVVVIDDLTPMIKGQREMAWREVARRIAHEIKNPLTPIKLSAQRLQRRMGGYLGSEGALLKECTDTIIKHTDELKEMVNEFSNFARFPEISPAPHDLHEVLCEAVALFKQAHSEVTFLTQWASVMPIFEFDRDQMKRVILNLLDNAISALSSDSSHSPRQVRLITHYYEPLQMAVIEVSDNGMGMTEEVRARVFEPYFSTKKEGSGLGLSIVKRIVNDHDGFIRVRSAPGEGTQFLIEIPTSRCSLFHSGVRKYDLFPSPSH
ncbi:MAG: sensor histidine kinase [Bdellovibrionia bacterium]